MVVHRLERLTVWCMLWVRPMMLKFVIPVELVLGCSSAVRTCMAAAPLVLPGFSRFRTAFLGILRLILLSVCILDDLWCVGQTPMRFRVLTVPATGVMTRFIQDTCVGDTVAVRGHFDDSRDFDYIRVVNECGSFYSQLEVLTGHVTAKKLCWGTLMSCRFVVRDDCFTDCGVALVV